MNRLKSGPDRSRRRPRTSRRPGTRRQLRAGTDVPIDQLLDDYDAQSADYRRHNGHLEILRELADGVRGNEP